MAGLLRGSLWFLGQRTVRMDGVVGDRVASLHRVTLSGADADL
jgi:hypothetical protein